jgi:DNA invertase Pin-like site-specific DNA recombinase
MAPNSPSARRCAIYTRKSSEEGLEQDFNSLHAQREACEAYIRSQASEGWQLIKTAYDDGGLSGGNMERPALQQLLADIRARRVDVVVVYKVDRLSRSLMDFLKMIEEFDRLGVSVVAITQQFNTTTSMGRLTLNILLSFAQFEREVTTERIRDKIAASKRKGMWMGGNLPLGYDVDHRKLMINCEEAETVKLIYQRYLELGCVRLLQQDLESRGIRSKARVSQAGKRSGGCAFSRGALYTLLANPIYVGDIRHKDAQYEGQHEAILDRELWQKVQQQLNNQGTARRGIARRSSISPLAGKLFDANGKPLVPSHAVKKGRRYRYYISQQLVSGRAKDAEGAWRLPAGEIEAAIATEAAQVIEDPGTAASLINSTSIDRRQAQIFVQRLKSCADSLKNDDQRAAALADLVQRVEIGNGTIAIDLNAANAAPEVALGEGGGVIHQEITLQLKRHGVETRLVIGGMKRQALGADPAITRLLSRAVSWWERIESGETSIEQIAKREKLSERYLRDVLQLAFLAPEIVERIATAGPPQNIRWDTLMSHPVLPLVWTEQLATFRLPLSR